MALANVTWMLSVFCVWQSYSNNLIDHHLILDLVPCLARMYFSAKLPVALSYGQAVILLCLGLQMRDISHIEKAMDLPLNQVLALFSKAVRSSPSRLSRILSKRRFAKCMLF